MELILNYINTTELMGYWSVEIVHANIILFFNILGALLLGFVVGYERYYHGRAAGMRTYGFVCMASCALVAIGGAPEAWYGGNGPTFVNMDPTRIIQGIVSGIGFLGAGMIMRDGFSISGLTTAAGIWASSAIGILVGLGLYGAAISTALLSVFGMISIAKLEHWLPSKRAISAVLYFKAGYIPKESRLIESAKSRGYTIALNTLSAAYKDGHVEWRFVAVANSRNAESLASLSEVLLSHEGIERHELAYTRN